MNLPLAYDHDSFCIVDPQGNELFSICFAEEEDAINAVQAINNYEKLKSALSEIREILMASCMDFSTVNLLPEVREKVLKIIKEQK